MATHETLKMYRLMIVCLLLIAQAVTLHTDLGDIKIELFCERTPRACEVSNVTLQ